MAGVLVKNDQPQIDKSCGRVSAFAYLRLHGIQCEYDNLCSRVPVSELGSNVQTLVDCANMFGLPSMAVRANFQALCKAPLPVIAHCDDYFLAEGLGGVSGHFVVVIKATPTELQILEPASGKILDCNIEKFIRSWSGVAIVPERTNAGIEKTIAIMTWIGWIALAPFIPSRRATGNQ